MKQYHTNYREAVNWLGNSYIRFNQIFEFDEDLWYRGFVNDELETEEIYQYYLTDATNEDVDFLIEHFNLKFAYSQKMDLWLLCVTHYGTAWDYVDWCTDIKNAKCELGESVRPF